MIIYPTGGIKCCPFCLPVSYWFTLDLQTNGQHQSYTGFEPPVGTIGDSKPGAYTSYPSVSSGVAPSLQVPMLLPQQATAPTLLGKG